MTTHTHFFKIPNTIDDTPACTHDNMGLGQFLPRIVTPSISFRITSTSAGVSLARAGT